VLNSSGKPQTSRLNVASVKEERRPTYRYQGGGSKKKLRITCQKWLFQTEPGSEREGKNTRDRELLQENRSTNGIFPAGFVGGKKNAESSPTREEENPTKVVVATKKGYNQTKDGGRGNLFMLC